MDKKVKRLKKDIREDIDVTRVVGKLVDGYVYFARQLTNELMDERETIGLKHQLQEINTINKIIDYLQESLGMEFWVSRMMLNDFEVDLMESMERLKEWTKNE